MKVADYSETSVCTYQTVLHVGGDSRFFQNIDMFLQNYTTSYTERQQGFPKRRYVHNKLHDFVYTQRQQVPPQNLSLSTELHRLTWVTACLFERSLRPGTHYPHVTWAHVMLRVQLGCERRFTVEFYGADSHFCHSAYVTWSKVPARLSYFCCRTHFVTWAHAIWAHVTWG